MRLDRDIADSDTTEGNKMSRIQTPRNRTQAVAQALAPWVAAALLILVLSLPATLL